MLEIAFMVITVILLGGILSVLKHGNNELVKGLESLDERLKNIEDQLGK